MDKELRDIYGNNVSFLNELPSYKIYEILDKNAQKTDFDVSCNELEKFNQEYDGVKNICFKVLHNLKNLYTIPDMGSNNADRCSYFSYWAYDQMWKKYSTNWNYTSIKYIFDAFNGILNNIQKSLLPDKLCPFSFNENFDVWKNERYFYDYSKNYNSIKNIITNIDKYKCKNYKKYLGYISTLYDIYKDDCINHNYCYDFFNIDRDPHELLYILGNCEVEKGAGSITNKGSPDNSRVPVDPESSKDLVTLKLNKLVCPFNYEEIDKNGKIISTGAKCYYIDQKSSRNSGQDGPVAPNKIPIFENIGVSDAIQRIRREKCNDIEGKVKHGLLCSYQASTSTVGLNSSNFTIDHRAKETGQKLSEVESQTISKDIEEALNRVSIVHEITYPYTKTRERLKKIYEMTTNIYGTVEEKSVIYDSYVFRIMLVGAFVMGIIFVFLLYFKFTPFGSRIGKIRKRKKIYRTKFAELNTKRSPRRFLKRTYRHSNRRRFSVVNIEQ
ncbi:PIR Superfamily Protein [Plasmodium malariae]|uniref:PIR Superfamily Protein n=1 Tax=Plasmodium malariae TaxID=5858 RepID=A0A1A8WPQ9_PLAMA|nr:PIR Superfamily Protein [Plasmodium malariae]